MGFHIFIVGYVFGIPLSLFREAPPNSGYFLFSLTNPTLLHVKPVNAAASRASSSRLKLEARKVVGLLLSLLVLYIRTLFYGILRFCPILKHLVLKG